MRQYWARAKGPLLLSRLGMRVLFACLLVCVVQRLCLCREEQLRSSQRRKARLQASQPKGRGCFLPEDKDTGLLTQEEEDEKRKCMHSFISLRITFFKFSNIFIRVVAQSYTPSFNPVGVNIFGRGATNQPAVSTSAIPIPCCSSFCIFPYVLLCYWSPPQFDVCHMQRLPVPLWHSWHRWTTFIHVSHTLTC